MDTLLIIFGAICLIVGLIGSIVPGLAGPPISFVGLVLLHLTSKVQFTTGQFVFWTILVLLTIVLDYLMPVLGVKRWDGTKWGNWGCIIGTVVGIFLFPPWGVLIGPFLGAVIGELMGGKQSNDALKAGFGAFIGFLAGTVVKLVVCGWFCYCFIAALF